MLKDLVRPASIAPPPPSPHSPTNTTFCPYTQVLIVHSSDITIFVVSLYWACYYMALVGRHGYKDRTLSNQLEFNLQYLHNSVKPINCVCFVVSGQIRVLTPVMCVGDGGQFSV